MELAWGHSVVGTAPATCCGPWETKRRHCWTSAQFRSHVERLVTVGPHNQRYFCLACPGCTNQSGFDNLRSNSLQNSPGLAHWKDLSVSL